MLTAGSGACRARPRGRGCPAHRRDPLAALPRPPGSPRSRRRFSPCSATHSRPTGGDSSSRPTSVRRRSRSQLRTGEPPSQRLRFPGGSTTSSGSRSSAASGLSRRRADALPLPRHARADRQRRLGSARPRRCRPSGPLDRSTPWSRARRRRRSRSRRSSSLPCRGWPRAGGSSASGSAAGCVRAPPRCERHRRRGHSCPHAGSPGPWGFSSLLGALGVGFSFTLALLFLCASSAAAALPVGPGGTRHPGRRRRCRADRVRSRGLRSRRRRRRSPGAGDPRRRVDLPLRGGVAHRPAAGASVSAGAGSGRSSGDRRRGATVSRASASRAGRKPRVAKVASGAAAQRRCIGSARLASVLRGLLSRTTPARLRSHSRVRRVQALASGRGAVV